eukprot:scaffold142948_cov151-Phaeocystis_antarctica.AAC.2
MQVERHELLARGGHGHHRRVGDVACARPCRRPCSSAPLRRAVPAGSRASLPDKPGARSGSLRASACTRRRQWPAEAEAALGSWRGGASVRRGSLWLRSRAS